MLKAMGEYFILMGAEDIMAGRVKIKIICLGFPTRNSAIIAQNLLYSWLTYLYKFKIHLVARHNKKSYW